MARAPGPLPRHGRPISAGRSPLSILSSTLFAFLATMCAVNDTLSAALLLSSNLPNVNVQDLLPHREELQSTLSILQQTLNSLSIIDRSEVTIRVAAAEAQHPQSSTISSHTPALMGDGERRVDDVGAPDADLSNLSAISTETNRNVVDLSLMASLPTDNNEMEQKVSLFMISLEKLSGKIHQFLDQDTVASVSTSTSWMSQDPRLVDISLDEKRSQSPTVRFRGWMARHSFADEYLTWAAENYKRKRTAFMSFDQQDADKRGQGHIIDYLTSIGITDGKTAQKTRKAIRYGLKYHSFEHLYGSPGVSAFLCQRFTSFRDLPIRCMKLLAESIRKSPKWSSLAKNKSDWISQCHCIYNNDLRKARHTNS